MPFPRSNPAVKTAKFYGPPHNATEIVKLPLYNGAEVNAEDSDGWTPLDFAVGNSEMLSLLRQHVGRRYISC